MELIPEIAALRNRPFREIDPAQFRNAVWNIDYAGTGDPRRQLDLILPDGEGPWPVAVIIHGGGYCSTSRRAEYVASSFKFASQGYAVAAVGYRLAPETPLPAQFHDVRMAVRYLAAHADELHLDVSNFFLLGRSAGANIAAMAALPVVNEILDGPAFVPSLEPLSVAGVISLYGRFEFDISQARLAGVIGDYVNDPEKLSFFTYLGTEYPPVLIQHGLGDKTIDWHQSQKAYDHITARCKESTAILELIPQAGHGDPAFSSDAHTIRCLEFMDRIRLHGGSVPRRAEDLPKIRLFGGEV